MRGCCCLKHWRIICGVFLPTTWCAQHTSHVTEHGFARRRGKDTICLAVTTPGAHSSLRVLPKEESELGFRGRPLPTGRGSTAWTGAPSCSNNNFPVSPETTTWYFLCNKWALLFTVVVGGWRQIFIMRCSRQEPPLLVHLAFMSAGKSWIFAGLREHHIWSW